MYEYFNMSDYYTWDWSLKGQRMRRSIPWYFALSGLFFSPYRIFNQNLTFPIQDSPICEFTNDMLSKMLAFLFLILVELYNL